MTESDKEVRREIRTTEEDAFTAAVDAYTEEWHIAFPHDKKEQKAYEKRLREDIVADMCGQWVVPFLYGHTDLPHK